MMMMMMMRSLTGLVVQAGRVQGADELLQTLLGSVHLPVSSHEEPPERHGRWRGAGSRWGEPLTGIGRRWGAGGGPEVLSAAGEDGSGCVRFRCRRKYEHQHWRTTFFFFGFIKKVKYCFVSLPPPAGGTPSSSSVLTSFPFLFYASSPYFWGKRYFHLMFTIHCVHVT